MFVIGGRHGTVYDYMYGGTLVYTCSDMVLCHIMYG